MEFCEKYDKTIGSQKTVFWLLVVSSFIYFKMHAWSTSVLLLLHSAFMLSMVKFLLQGEVGVCALITLLIMENHGKIMELFFEFLWEPCKTCMQSNLYV